MMEKTRTRRELLASAPLGAAALLVGAGSPAGLEAAKAAPPAGKDPKIHAMTAGNLRSAFGGESMARMRYTIWGGMAQTERLPNVARLFRAIAYAEQVHASNHFGVMAGEAGAFLVASMGGFGLAGTSQNLAGAIEGELFEVNEMYPVYIKGAESQSQHKAVRSFRWALEAEKIHAGMFQKARKAVDAGKDAKLAEVGICSLCGYTVEGDPPSRCPICAAKKDKFKIFA